MNIRVLDKNDKAALEQLIYTIENALPVPEWWIPIDDIERSHFFDADWTCFLGAFNDDNELVAASALFFNEHEFAELCDYKVNKQSYIPLGIKDENTKSHGGNPLYGEWITGTCPRCKQDVQLGMNYCSNCGQKLLWKEEK